MEDRRMVISCITCPTGPTAYPQCHATLRGTPGDPQPHWQSYSYLQNHSNIRSYLTLLSSHEYIQTAVSESVMNGCVIACSLSFCLTLHLLLTKDYRVAASMDLLSVIASHRSLFLAQYFIQMVVQIRQSANITEN